jgi:S-adenosylmethionine uptake transporter
MLIASLLFALMSVCVKLASPLYTTSEIIFFRGLLGILFITGARYTHAISLKTPYWKEHGWRSLAGVCSLWLWFYSFDQLPLATAVTLNYTAPIWIATILYLTTWWRKQQHPNWSLTLCIIASFIGVTILLRPSMHQQQWLGGIVALTSGFFAALAYLQVKKLSLMGEPDHRIVFYFSVGGLIVGFLGAIIETGHTHFLFHSHTSKGLALLLGIGVFATLAQMTLTRAYRLGNTLVASNLQYSGIIFASSFGALIWDDTIDPLGWLGIIIIIFSGSFATIHHKRAHSRSS